MAITSNLQMKENTILISQEDMETGNLKSDSLIRVDKIDSINKELIVKTFGEINSRKFNLVLDKLLFFLKEI